MVASKHQHQPLFDTLQYEQEQERKPQLLTELTGDIKNKATQDYQLCRKFLLAYQGSEATFNAYRRELERLLQWSWQIAHKTLQALKREDIEAFVRFCQAPPAEWIGLKNVPRFLERHGERVVNTDWRPFVATISKSASRHGQSANPKQYTPSQKAVQAIFSVLSSFFNYLIQENYLAANPVSQIRQKSKFIRKQQGHAPIRRLSELQWAYVIETAELMATDEPLQHERTLFIMNSLYGMYLRISELAASTRWEPQMGHFHRDIDDNWWFKTVGKGNKERIISVSNAMLNALRRYRQFLQLSPLPHPGETTPLIQKFRGTGPVSSTRQIRDIVQACFDRAIERMKYDNFQEDAEALMAATVHWLRHTGISDDVKHRPREHVRDDAGHGSSAITDRYIDIELRERHASAKKKPLKPDEVESSN